jgi:hypothetical protein
MVGSNDEALDARGGELRQERRHALHLGEESAQLFAGHHDLFDLALLKHARERILDP